MTKPNPSGRLSNTTTCLPIAYGSIAFYLGPKADEYRTHKWTLYVRSPDPTYDISAAISKVIFQLHPSFPQPTRELSEPPYEVTETGWGEFEASIRIVWKEDAEERSTIVTHGIKLYPKNVPPNLLSMDPAAYMNTTVPVVSEKYDEVVFTNPKATFHQCLLNGHLKNNKKLPYPLSNEPLVMEHFRTYGDEAEVKVMLEAKKFLEGELRNVKDRLLRVDAELEEVKHELSAAKELEGGLGLLPGGAGGAAGGGGGGASTAITAIPTSSAMGNNKPGIVSSANTTVVVAGSKGNRGGKTLKKKAPPPPPPPTTTTNTIATSSSAPAAVVATAAVESQQPTGKKMKAS